MVDVSLHCAFRKLLTGIRCRSFSVWMDVSLNISSWWLEGRTPMNFWYLWPKALAWVAISAYSCKIFHELMTSQQRAPRSSQRETKLKIQIYNDSYHVQDARNRPNMRSCLTNQLFGEGYLLELDSMYAGAGEANKACRGKVESTFHFCRIRDGWLMMMRINLRWQGRT